MTSEFDDVTIHPLAVVEPGATIGRGSSVWHHAHVRSGAVIGEDCVIGIAAPEESYRITQVSFGPITTLTLNGANSSAIA